ncbi:hypothetical protein IMSAGC013_01244 [Lachnospiraceae bacterium]|nr:hypothetical protein [Lachnospiraceae bacterium]GFI29857.1 hypothetical protein IMSAGC013_01244 [Lachnospiraceae bacterium]
MKKKGLFGGTAFVLAFMMFSVTAFAVPSNRCVTTMEGGNRAAMGITECHSATACSVTVTGNYSDGGSTSQTAHGIVVTGARVTVPAPREFSSANSRHKIEYYSAGILNVYNTASGAGRN